MRRAERLGRFDLQQPDERRLVLLLERDEVSRTRNRLSLRRPPLPRLS